MEHEHITIHGNMGELTQAINKVSGAVGALKPDKKNTQGNYWYISADKFLDACRSAMARNGLSITQAIVNSKVYIEDKNGKGKPFFCADLLFSMIVADTKGNYMIVPFESAGVDYTVPDKARFKAITSGHKYFMMKLFSVGIGDENNDSEHMVVEHSPQPQQQKPTTQPTAGNAQSEQPKTYALAQYLEGYNQGRTYKVGTLLDVAEIAPHYNHGRHLMNTLNMRDDIKAYNVKATANNEPQFGLDTEIGNAEKFAQLANYLINRKEQG